jgi:hypothetical protein
MIMLVTFHSKSYADITMFEDVAVQLLCLMGQSGKVPGALLADDVAMALERLKAGLEQAGREAAPEPLDKDDEEGADQNVSLVHRAFPLVELLSAAATDKSDVVWDH